jgi:hypothetical protein
MTTIIVLPKIKTLTLLFKNNNYLIRYFYRLPILLT